MDVRHTLWLAFQYLRYFPYVNLDLRTPFPLILFVELTRTCNMRCSQCDIWLGDAASSSDPAPATLTLSDMIGLADEASAHGAIIIHLGGGEPLLHRDILEIVRAVHARRIKIGLTTNGFLLTPSLIDDLVEAGLSRLLISVDHPIPEVHDALRGRSGTLERIIEAVSHINAMPAASKRLLTVEVNTVLHRGNFRDLIDLSRFVHGLGVKTHNLIPIMSQNPVTRFNGKRRESNDLSFRADDLPELRGLINGFFEFLRSHSMRTTTSREILRKAIEYYEGTHKTYICAVGGVSCDIFADGDVMLCYGSEKAIGNIRDATLHDIWHSETARTTISKLASCTRCVDSCQADLRIRFSPRYLIDHWTDLLREAGEILF